MIDGALIIDKPEGWTSHDVVARLRTILKTRKVGHTGTLDPFATGVMLVLVGKATRLARFVDRQKKEYVALVRFGFGTDTGDRTGNPSTETLELDDVSPILGKTDWNSVLSRFRGKILQVPPMFSAKKVGGKKLYQLARKGIEVKREPVEVEIHAIEVKESRRDSVMLRILCSAGTYVRVIAEDLGREIGIPAHLGELCRTRSGPFGIEQSLTLDELDRLDPKEIAGKSVSMRELVSHLPEVIITVSQLEDVAHGRSVMADLDGGPEDFHIRLSREDGELVAVGVYIPDEGSIHPRIVLV